MVAGFRKGEAPLQLPRVPLFKVFMAPEALERVSGTLKSGYIGQGQRVDEFEDLLQETLALSSRPLAVSSCTHAIDLALHLCGVGPGDDVVSPAITCTATNSPIVRRGANIIWAEINSFTGCIDVEKTASLCNNGAHSRRARRAIICVDWAGRRCDYEKLRELTGGCIPIIQDAAHGPLVKPGGDLVCYSFQAIKHLTCGDGGALYVNPSGAFAAVAEGLSKRARLLRWYGLDRTKSESFRCEQDIKEVGYKYHMNDISASIGLGNLPHLKQIIQAHSFNARCLYEVLMNCKWASVPTYDYLANYWIFTLVVKDRSTREHLRSHLDRHGIDSSQVHARNCKHTAFLAASYLPASSAMIFDDKQLSIPCGWWLTALDLARITEALETFNP